MKVSISLIAAALLHFLPVQAQGPGEDPLLRWMDKIAQEQLQVRENEIAAVRTMADAERRKAVVRRNSEVRLSIRSNRRRHLNLTTRATGKAARNGRQCRSTAVLHLSLY